MKNQSYSAILITVLLVVGMSVGLVGVVSATNHSTELVEGDNYWTGQELVYSDTTNDLTQSDIEIEELVDGEREFVTELSADGSDSLTINSEGYTTGTYVLVVDGDSSNEEVEFDLRVQNLNVTPEESQLVNGNGEDSTTSLNIESNRVDFEMNVTSDSLNGDELQTVFDGGTVSADNDSVLRVSESDLESVNFSSVESSEYVFEFDVVDANANSSSTVTVSEPGDAQADFNMSSFSADAGDSSKVSVNLEETDSATVTLGDQEELGYELVVDVTDSDEDGDVTFEFDSYQAGQSDDVVSSEDDEVTVVDQTNFDADQRLVPSRYELSVEVDEGGETRQTDISFFNLNERTLNGVTSYGIPSSDVVSEYDDLDNVTKADVVAEGDYVALGFEVSGVFGAFDESGVSVANDLAEDGALSNNHGIYVEVVEADPSLNAQPDNVNLNDADLYYNETESQIFLVYNVDTENTDFEFDTEYEAELRITDSNDYLDEDEEEVINSTYTVAEEESSFAGLNQEDRLEVVNSDEFDITTETNLAEGTEDEFVVTIPDADDPTVDTYNTTVENGTMTATVDISSLDVGDEFTVDMRTADVSETTAVVIEEAESELSVNVVDEDGNPVENAEVTVNNETLSGQSGTFVLETGDYNVEAQAEGYESLNQTVTVEDDKMISISLAEEEQTETYNLTVDVVDDTGNNVEGAEVTVGNQTQTGGTTTFELASGDYNVSVTSDGYEDNSIQVTVDEDSTTTAKLTSDSSSDSEDGINNNVIIFGGVGAIVLVIGGVLVYTRKEE